MSTLPRTLALGAVVALAALPAAAQQPIELAPSGAWNWYGNPRGIYHNGQLITGHVASNGNVQTVSYDLATGAIDLATILTPAQIKPGDPEIDDHNPPSFFETSDGRLTAFAAGHNESDIWYRVAQTPGQADWGDLRTIDNSDIPGTKGHTYPQAFALPGSTDQVFLSWRGANWNPSYSIGTYSTASQSWSWTPAANYIADPANSSSVRPYTLIHGNGDKIGLLFTDNHPRDASNNLYYAQIARDGDGDLAFFQADGTPIRKVATGPLQLSEAQKVFDRTAAPQTDGDNSWGWDIAFDDAGLPVVTYATFVPDAARPDLQARDTHQYHYARFDGQAWQDHTLVADAGGTIANLQVGNRSEYHYSGGVALDPSNPDLVYLSRKVGGQFELERWLTDDGGATWDVTALTATPGVEDVRPFVPIGLPRDLEAVVWMSGQYEYWEPVSYNGGTVSWDTRVLASVRLVPEPAAGALLAALGPALLARRRRR